MTFRHLVEHGKFLRRFVTEPVTSLVRQEDLSYCASRLLLLRQYVGRRDPALGDLLEKTLEDLARLSPNSALDRLRGGEGTWGNSPVYWCLANHVLAQVLSEFSAEVPASTVTELRSSLGQWFPRLRETLEQVGGLALDDKFLVCLQCFLTQCAIFHDAGSFEWAGERMLGAVTPQSLDSEVAVECAALLAGIFSRPQDEGVQAQLVGMLTQAGAAGNTMAKEAVGSMAGLIVVDPMRHSTSTTTLPVEGSRGPSKLVQTPGSKKKAKKSFSIGETIGTYSWLIILLVVIAVCLGCIGGVGWVYDWFEHNSNVGNQSIKDWYATAEANNDATRNQDGGLAVSETPEPIEDILADVVTPVPTPTIAPTPPPTPTPAPLSEEEIRAAFDVLNEKHTRFMKSRLGIPRQAESINGGATVTVHCEYIRTDPPIISKIGGWKASVTHRIKWFEERTHVGTHSIEARYEWTGTEWKLTAAARCLNVKDAHGNTVYATSADERAWAEALFTYNPFYE
ncbi:MAG: hypothetical protein PWP23_1092 [Candidatus Sumerlaeota bacterium]|nr:hypothetical protein [Candidatus Sumerlaeota bacterium]